MNRKILVSLGIIAALALYIFISGRNWSSDIPTLEWKDKPDEITMVSAERSIRLRAKEGKWVINDEAYPADSATVDNIVSKMKDLEITDLISKQGFLEKYELTPEKRIVVEMKKGGAAFRTVTFGKKGPTNRHTFVMVGKNRDIYLASGVFGGLLNKTVDELRDKTIMKIARDSVSSFSVTSRGKTFAFEKRQTEEFEAVKEKNDKTAGKKDGKEQKPRKKKVDTWVCLGSEKTPIEKAKIDQFLSALDPLKASNFCDPDVKIAGAPVATVKISAGGKQSSLMVYGKNRENRYNAKYSESPYAFTIDEWRAKKFFVDSLDSFRKKE